VIVGGVGSVTWGVVQGPAFRREPVGMWPVVFPGEREGRVSSESVVERSDEPVPRGLRVVAAWSWRLLVIIAVGYLLLRAIAHVAVLVVPLLIGVLLVALVRPVTDLLMRVRLGRFQVSRGLAALLTVLLTLTVIAGLIAVIGQQIVVGFPSLREQTAAGLTDLQERLAASPLKLTSDQVNSYLSQVTERLRTDGTQLLSGALQVTSRAADVGTGFFIVLFSSFFFLSGGDRIWSWLVGLFPRGARSQIHVAGTLAWSTLTSFVRATVIVALVDGTGVGLIAWLLGVPLPIPLGVLVFLGAFVPIVGALVSGSAAVLVALVAQGPVMALFMLIGVLAVQQLESHVLQPFLMGRAVRVHPLAVVLGIGAGVLLAGIAGALFAVPVIAVTNVVVSYLVRGKETSPNGVLAGGAGVVSWPLPGVRIRYRSPSGDTADVDAASVTLRPTSDADSGPGGPQGSDGADGQNGPENQVEEPDR
jgi:putative heme transporter